MTRPDAIPARLTGPELVELCATARALLSPVDKARLSAEMAEYRRELCPRGWRWDEAKVRQESRRRAAARELVNVGVFAA